jgi:hypothetical protein
MCKYHGGNVRIIDPCVDEPDSRIVNHHVRILALASHVLNEGVGI